MIIGVEKIMLSMKDLILINVAIAFIIISFILSPFTEQYQGATGYVYEYGLYYAIVQIVLMIVAVMLVGIVIFHRDNEVSS